MSSSIVKNDNNCAVAENESELIAKCLAQDRLAQHQLFNRYAKKMLTVCNRYSNNMEDAEDTLSEGFARVFEKLGSYKGIGSFEGWIRKIMVNAAIEKFRRKNLAYTELKDKHFTHNADLADNEINSQINAKQLMALIQKLPPAYQMVFNLYVFEGYKHKEIADMLGISEGTSKSNLSDARTWLKKGIENLTTEKIPVSNE